MKKCLSFLLAMLLLACAEAGSNETRAGIIAEDMVKEDVISGDDLEFNLVGVDKVGLDEYHVVADIKTTNGLGLKVPRKVSVRLKYIGGDWSDINSWSKISISYLDESTGRTQTSTPQAEPAKAEYEHTMKNPYSDKKDGDTITVAGIVFTIKVSSEDDLLICSDYKLTPDKIKEVCEELDIKYIAFYYKGQTIGKDDPYSMKMEKIIFYGEDVI